MTHHLKLLVCINVTDEQRWSAVTGEGTVPSPRDKCACAVIDKQIFFFGGFGPEGMPVNVAKV